MSPSRNEKNRRRSMSIRLDYTNVMEDAVGLHHGIAKRDIDYLGELAKKAQESLKARRQSGELDFMTLPYHHAYLEDVQRLAAELKNEFEIFVVIGIGGSALGNIAVQTALNPPFYNELSPEQRNGGLKIYVPDNVDPCLMRGLLNVIDIKKTVFNIITKSGSTAETLANFLVVRQAIIDSVGENNYKNHIVITTDPQKGVLRKIADSEGFRSLEVPIHVGGRFSVLSSVGLLSAAAANIDIVELLEGAAFLDSHCFDNDVFSSTPCLNAAIQYLIYQKGKHISVMMPYAQALKDIADWYRQLWAESLGKKHNRAGRIINVGPTPVKALGATDQHSQLQLYNEGPNDKIITFITVDKYPEEVFMPKAYDKYDAFSYLGGKTLNELLSAEQQATEYALTQNNRPNCKIILPEINPFTVGQLLYMLEMQTAFAGELFDVNAFDQPGVEEGKIATYALMGRKGYEKKRKELLKALNS